MSKFLKTLLTVGLSAGMALGSLLPAQAMPLASAPAASGLVEQVQWRHDDYRRPPPGYYGRDYGRDYRRDYRRPPPMYNGYRGESRARPGYRRHSNGYWFPLAAFAAGAMIGGAIAAPSAPRAAPSSGINPKHYEWCSARYRSYRSYDNTFQPNYGPRQQCYSPYY